MMDMTGSVEYRGVRGMPQRGERIMLMRGMIHALVLTVTAITMDPVMDKDIRLCLF